MNLWTRFRLHLRRDALRHRFMRSQTLLQTLFQLALLERSTAEKRRWQHVEWLTDPLLYLIPDEQSVPVALVGVAASYTLVEIDAEPSPALQTQAGTALFYFENNAWQTHGKLLLNITPSQALTQLERQAISPLPV